MAADGARVTIAAIADAAGVSVPTVSRVLNGRTDVVAGDPRPDRAAAPRARLPPPQLSAAGSSPA